MGGRKSKLALGLLFFLLVSASASMVCDWDQCTPEGPVGSIQFTYSSDNRFFSTTRANCEFGDVNAYALTAIKKCLDLKTLINPSEIITCLLKAPELLDKLSKIAALSFRLKVPLATFLQSIEPPEFDKLDFTSETTGAKFESIESKRRMLIENWGNGKSQISQTKTMIKSAQDALKGLDKDDCVKDSLEKAAKEGRKEADKKIPAIKSKIISEMTK